MTNNKSLSEILPIEIIDELFVQAQFDMTNTVQSCWLYIFKNHPVESKFFSLNDIQAHLDLVQ